jgi:hypothetical protein
LPFKTAQMANGWLWLASPCAVLHIQTDHLVGHFFLTNELWKMEM